MAENVQYRPLRGGRSSTLAVRNRLWTGPDHLLLVAHVFGSESYRRYYFKDIQALVVTPTLTWHVSSVLCGIFAALLLLSGVLLWKEAGIVWLVLGGILVLGLLVNLLQGPSAKFQILTGAGRSDLGGGLRLRRARKIILQLAPMIEAAQAAAPVAQAEPVAAAPMPADAGTPPAGPETP